MSDKSVKLTILKTVYAILVFALSVLIISKLSNGDNADMTARMGQANLPLVTLVSNGVELNPLHGYLTEMDVSHMRGTIYPVGTTREIEYKIATYGEKVYDIKFEVRNIEGTSLVESTPLTDYKEDSTSISGKFQLKDLITSNKEYMLVMVMNTDVGEARYYSRIVWTGDEEKYNLDKEVEFVLGFSEATFSKTAASEYSKYLESNSEGDNTTFSKVNIHSSFNQVTWGNLNITKHTSPEVYITDLHSQTGCYKLQYRVTLKDGSASRTYNVVEAYRVRYTSDRIYLLNYERTMNYIFDSSSYSISSNTIGLSISDPDIQLMESSGGSCFAFVSENRLYMFNNSESKLAFLFGFYDSSNNDVRTRWDNNTIKILRVDEAGNVKFVVAGYMNRGVHEGHVGIAVYDYNASINAVEEQIFIESKQSAEILTNYVDTLSHASSNDVFYTMLEGNVYAIDLIGRTASPVAYDIGSGEYKISESESILAWQSSDLKSLNIMNLNNKNTSEIKADDGEYIILLGFMGEDLVYGVSRSEDLQNDQMGNPIYAMYSLKIVDGDGNVLENYNPDGIYVTSVEIVNNQIKLSRVVKDDSGAYVATYDDQIMSTLKAETGSNVVSQVSVDTFEKIVQITAKSEIKVKQLRVLTPDQTLFEGDRNVNIDYERDEKEAPFYYVYGLMGIEGIFLDPADAVSLAYDAPGVVINDSNKYVWLKGNLLTSNQIMSITRNAESYEGMTSKNSTAVCLDLMLQFEGVNRNVEALLDQGQGVVQILEDLFPDADVLDLDGCSMQAMLYYVNQDIPVMAMLNDGTSVLIIGFNSQNTVLMNPTTGQVYKYGMNDSEKLFSENGNHFITYIMEE
ncbi:hypothetical protein [Butyrivibrio proteoclasticus]|uniref:hypothetical protein n=1 Tax=Butyrivibrio proteoclasticus TaxID=43305 RepID=UPI00054FE5E3|nr:hypothetical protein [Butyrivibrio proteoclasticus]